MIRKAVAKQVGRRLVAKTIETQAAGGRAETRRGLALFRDRQVPFRAKALAMLCGFAFLGVLNVLEMPIEGAIALALPLLGWPPLLIWNGIELIVVPLAVGSLVLSRMVAYMESKVNSRVSESKIRQAGHENLPVAPHSSL